MLHMTTLCAEPPDFRQAGLAMSTDYFYPLAAVCAPMKHVPFQSIYREEFEVVEQKLGNVSLYPHTDQLPVLHRAINLEFLGALPGYITRIDKRADDFHKILMRYASMMYSLNLNSARADRLRLYAMPDNDLVYRLTVVQHMIEAEPLGRVHRFRFYGPNGFIPEIRLSGKRIAFADHVIQRFTQRVPNRVGEDLTNLLMIFFGCEVISLPVGPGRAFIIGYDGYILAFTYKETDDEYFITTCLTVNEMSSLREESPVRAYNFHYGENFTEPAERTLRPDDDMREYIQLWQRRAPFKGTFAPKSTDAKKKPFDWRYVAPRIREITLIDGHGPGSRIEFRDYIPGPHVMLASPPENVPEGDKLRARYLTPKRLPGGLLKKAPTAAAPPPKTG